MAIDVARPSQLRRPVSSPLPKTRTTPPKRGHGPHWRPSINRLLQSTPLELPKTCRVRSKKSCDRSPYLELPQELQDIIESYLSSADLLCLRQTCAAQRHAESVSHINPAFDLPFTMSLQVHSLRARLDRDYYHVICEHDNILLLSDRHYACSFCHTLHSWKHFSQAQVLKPPQNRRCKFVLRNYLVCGNYWTSPTDLRELLETLTANDERFDRTLLHDVPDPRKGLDPSKSPNNIPVSTIVENTPHIARDRSAFSTSVHGLKFTHHFHLQSHPDEHLQPAIYRFASALESPRRSVLAICPHLTVNSAGMRLGLMQDVNRGLIGECPEKACKTVFGWFECESETKGWRDLCFKVERRFGWLESLGGEFWGSQTVK